MTHTDLLGLSTSVGVTAILLFAFITYPLPRMRSFGGRPSARFAAAIDTRSLGHYVNCFGFQSRRQLDGNIESMGDRTFRLCAFAGLLKFLRIPLRQGRGCV